MFSNPMQFKKPEAKPPNEQLKHFIIKQFKTDRPRCESQVEALGAHYRLQDTGSPPPCCWISIFPHMAGNGRLFQIEVHFSATAHDRFSTSNLHNLQTASFFTIMNHDSSAS
jgi:hypothetical protein